MSACPATIGLSNSGIFSGGWLKSASITTRNSLCAARAPAITAPARPSDGSLRSTRRTASSRSDRMRSRVPSVELSSTKMISVGGVSIPRIRSTSGPMFSASFSVGITRAKFIGRCFDRYKHVSLCYGGSLLLSLRAKAKAGADDGIRTRDLRFTKPLLYQLSYIGESGGGRDYFEWHRCKPLCGPLLRSAQKAKRCSCHTSKILRVPMYARPQRIDRMTTKIVLPRTRRAMAIYTVVAIAITAAAIQQHAEQVRVARI